MHIPLFIWAALLISTLIVIHELAHFAAALLAGVKVEVFSLGFGRRLFGIRCKEIDFRLSAIPLGGYVRMLGENASSTELRGVRGSFQTKPKAARAFILFAGPAANCITAVAIFAGLYCHGFVDLFEPLPKESPVEIDWVQPGSPAAQAGLLRGDILREANGRFLHNQQTAMAIIRTSNGLPLHFLIARQGHLENVIVQPRRVATAGGNVWQMGTKFTEWRTPIKLPFPHAVIRAAGTTVQLSGEMVVGLIDLVRGNVAPSSLIGPIGITQMAGQAAARGMAVFLVMGAVVSVNLGLFNLLPIPVLDGGALAILLLKSYLGKDLSPRVRQNITKAGFAVIGGLMLMATFNDLVHFLTTLSATH